MKKNVQFAVCKGNFYTRDKKPKTKVVSPLLALGKIPKEPTATGTYSLPKALRVRQLFNNRLAYLNAAFAASRATTRGNFALNQNRIQSAERIKQTFVRFLGEKMTREFSRLKKCVNIRSSG